jgi:hypothetical protein
LTPPLRLDVSPLEVGQIRGAPLRLGRLSAFLPARIGTGFSSRSYAINQIGTGSHYTFRGVVIRQIPPLTPCLVDLQYCLENISLVIRQQTSSNSPKRDIRTHHFPSDHSHIAIFRLPSNGDRLAATPREPLISQPLRRTLPSRGMMSETSPCRVPPFPYVMCGCMLIVATILADNASARDSQERGPLRAHMHTHMKRTPGDS